MDIRRSKNTHARYKQEIETHPNMRTEHHYDPLQDTVIKEYTHWYIIKNNFPYDNVAEVHDMLVPKRIFKDLTGASPEELTEYNQIMKELHAEGYYDSFQNNFEKDRSVLRHLHIHLLVWKQI